ncbi:DUF397 domain-containing protein [Streptomyces sp. JA03]|nr:DUF397 domain-containing protein [Streptomyces barringtoniae]
MSCTSARTRAPSYRSRRGSPHRRHARACLEVAVSACTMHIRGSKNSPAASPALHLTRATWVAFTASLK